jgi:hypothetical protein
MILTQKCGHLCTDLSFFENPFENSILHFLLKVQPENVHESRNFQNPTPYSDSGHFLRYDQIEHQKKQN